MNCTNCGSQIPEGSNVCLVCGTAVANTNPDVSIFNQSIDNNNNIQSLNEINQNINSGENVVVNSNPQSGEPMAATTVNPDKNLVVDPNAQPVVETVVSNTVNPDENLVVNPSAQPVVETVVSNTVNPDKNLVVDPNAQPVVEPVVSNTVNLGDNVVVDPNAQPVVESVVSNTVNPDENLVVDPNAQPVVEPVVSNTVNPIADNNENLNSSNNINILQPDVADIATPIVQEQLSDQSGVVVDQPQSSVVSNSTVSPIEQGIAEPQVNIVTDNPVQPLDTVNQQDGNVAYNTVNQSQNNEQNLNSTEDVNNNQSINNNEVQEQTKHNSSLVTYIGLTILGFLPIIGWIMFFIMFKKNPKNAKYIGIGSIIFFVAVIVFFVVNFMIGVMGG